MINHIAENLNVQNIQKIILTKTYLLNNCIVDIEINA